MFNHAVRIQDFRYHLADMRESKGYSQSQLSQYSGLDLDYIQEIESGSADLELSVLITLAETLEIDIKGLPD
jgi:transcriptional regulator with XRE-family HTH domain